MEAGLGAVSGTISYEADPQRPWRLGRYYIQGGKSGALAEAVVALTAKDLHGPKKPEPSTINVDQKNFQFTPETVAIQQGDRVQFLNSDAQVHNVQAFHLRHSFNVNMPAKSKHVETFPHAVPIKRPYRLGCVYHSAMQAWIFVFDHPWYQVTKTNGEFQLADVPPGAYTLVVSHPAGNLRFSKPVIVTSQKAATLDITLNADHLVTKEKKD